jgi:thiamine kinase-like enzyme
MSLSTSIPPSPKGMEHIRMDIVSSSGAVDVLISHQSSIEELGVSDGTATPPVEVFSTLSSFHSIASICRDVIPGWRLAIGESALSEAVEVKQMMEGLSNQLFRVRIKRDGVATFNTVLFRIYGEHVSSFYNPDHELRVFGALSAVGIGPKMVANGPGWRVEEFHEDSSPLLVSTLPNPSTFSQIASILGRLHKVHKHPKFPKEDFDQVNPITFARLDDWVREGLAALSRLPQSEILRDKLRIDEVTGLVDKIKSVLRERSAQPGLAGNEIVFCHNDAQENNILVTPYGLRLIDFEYADFNFQFADIGNVFNEFTMDYCWPEPPLFKASPEDYPCLHARRMFASVYLSEYLDRPVLDIPGQGASMIDQLLEGAEIGSQLSHILWGFWSLVRAQQQAEGTTSFDFVSYAQYRFDEFLKKKELLGW